MPNPSALRWLWQERLQSRLPIDQSGVWRFRELLPILLHPEKAVTLREGNTPLYRLLQSAEELGVEQLYAKHQGTNPTGSFKDTGMTAALFAGPGTRLPVGGVRFHRQHFGLDGGLRLASPHEQPGLAPGGQNLLVQTLPGARLRLFHLSIEY